MSDICRKRKELCLLLGMFIILASQSGGNAKSSCSRSVKKLKLPPHTKFAKSQKNARETKILCDKGYFFSKGKSEAVIKCRKGVIAKPIPACRGCNPPPKINNGTTKFSSTSVGSKVRYSCDVGYTLVGRRQRRCGKNFKWSGREKTYCRRNKCLKPRLVIRNGNVTTSDPSYYEFATLSFECKEGYELLGEEDIVCRNNKWSSNRFPFCRRKRCPNPGQPNNGRRFGSQFYIGSTVEFFCNSGYKLYGSSKRTCQKDQTWNGTLTICDDGRSHCRDPGTPIGAIRDGKLYNIGNIVKYRCKPGFKLVGSSNRTCKRNKNWSGIQPKCVDENYREFPPINETAIRLQEGFVGSLLQVTCSGTNVSCPKIDARARALNLKYKEGLDLIFVLDASSSIKTENFNTAKGFLKEIVEIFGISDRPDGTRIACVTYGTKANVEFTFNADSVSTKDKALKRIDKISYTRGGTATRLALNEVEKTILPSARKGSVKALFIITDGNSNIGGKPKKAAEVLKRKKVEIYVVGIGKKVTQESLYDLASEPKKEHVFNIKAYKDLKKVRRKIVVPPDYSRCGYPYYKPKDSRARIVGGRESRESDWPWAVRIFVKGSHVCGGALIKDEWVLTAAHCFNNEHHSQVQIVFNNEKGTVKTSTKYVIHQDYIRKIFKNDIALVKFPKLARFDRRRQPICLPKEIDMSKIIQSGNKLHAVGWGGTKKVGKDKFANSKDYSKVLKEVDIPFTQDKDCAEKVRQMVSQGHRDWYFNNVTQFCAGDKLGKVDTCQGDSGGPALVLHNDPVKNKPRWYQIGIVSWGHGCAQKGEYGFYTKVSAFLSWIDNEIKK